MLQSSVLLKTVLIALALGIAAVPGCGSGAAKPRDAAPGGGGGADAGKTGSGGTTTDVATAGTGGASATGGASGTTDAMDSAGDAAIIPDTATTDVADAGGTFNDANDAGEAGGPDATAAADITKVAPTAGCGQAPGAAGAGTVMTMGTKEAGCADSKCGPWAYPRDYFVYLPQGYVNTKAYPLVILGPGCGGTVQNIYPLNDGTADNAGNAVIRVGILPPPNTIGHATNPNQGCFDDKEGDDSVDWVFYETLYDKLAAQFCFDRNRVFVGGNSSGSWFANEAGCKYAGDDSRPIRGVVSNTGGLPSDPRYRPTCTTSPMSGFWVYENGDFGSTFPAHKLAIARAMTVNGCTIGNGVDNAALDDFPIGGANPAATCKQIRGCPPLHPLVVCPIPGNANGSHDAVFNPGASTFIKQFSTGAFVTF